MDRTGSCLCGAVAFVAKGVKDKGSACHCGMCRRWASGPWIGVSVDAIEWKKNDALETIASSQWAERGFCKKCGSSLFYRMSAGSKYEGNTSVALGSLDDQSGITLTREWFIDKKPDAYALAGDRKRVTEAEALAMLTAD